MLISHHPAIAAGFALFATAVEMKRCPMGSRKIKYSIGGKVLARGKTLLPSLSTDA
jgi:hypothetical protein